MSATECSMLNEAQGTYRWLYIPANFAVHYLPSLVGIYLAPPELIHIDTQLYLGASIFLVYSTTINTPHVYGCPIPRGVAGTAAFVFVSLVSRMPFLRKQMIQLCTNPIARNL